jgi:integrase/recombinase XerD
MTWDGTSLPKARVPMTELSSWEARTGPSGILADTGPAAEWRAATIAFNWRAYLIYLGWLAHCGLYSASSAIGERFSCELIIAFVMQMRGRGNSAATILMRVLALERVLAVMAPEVDRTFLRTIIRNLPEGRDASARRARLQETAVLVDLGISLMMHVEQPCTRLTRQLATMFRDGLQIALLALRPFRRGNFASISIGKNLFRRGDDWWLIFDVDETKNCEVIDVPFPAELVPWLEKYLDIYRPLLAGSRYQGDALWLTYWFSAEDDTSVYGQIVKRTEDAFTLAVNPHLFRHCLATSLAINDPKLIGIAHLMLGNSIETCQREYNLAQTHMAGMRLSDAITSKRDRLRKQLRFRPE